MSWKIVIRQQFYRIKAVLRLKSFQISKMPFYAVARGRTPGIFGTWADCESQVKGFSGARYKKFNTATEAQEYLDINGESKLQQKSTSFKNTVSLPARPFTIESSSLKRPFNNKINSDDGPSRLTKEKKKSTKAKHDSNDSDDSDDLNTIIIKQIDDIEKRLNGFKKGVDNIIKKSAKSDRKAIMIDPPNNFDQFDIDEDGYVQVYTDGACSSNGKKGAKAGLGVYWGAGHYLNISEPVSGRATNNCGEIQAATRAIQQAIDINIDKLAINTDSKFLINSVTKWIFGWKRKGWKLSSGEPVKNEKDFKELDKIQNKINIKWNYVEAHKGILGNERADQLAKAGAAMYSDK